MASEHALHSVTSECIAGHRQQLAHVAIVLAVAGALPAIPAHAASIDGVFELGSVVSRSDRPGQPPAGETALNREQLDQFNRETVGEAASLVPGVNLSRNSRNEDTVFVRGFDPRQVPVFLDGIPLYVPYDGYVDFGRFTTFDLAEIRVAKGTASMLYGPNILGGAVNLVSRRPTRALEGDVRLGAGSGGEQKAAVNLGSRQDLWYLQAGLSWLDADNYPLPGGFIDYKTVPSDTGDKRANAYRTDRRASVKLGLTPNDHDEYALGYVKQEGEKGNPVYTGPSSRGVRYWRWPYWDKESLYFIGNIGLGDRHALKLRAYEDRYGNGLEAYTDASYSQAIDNTSFPSAYDDRTRGVAVEVASQVLEGHALHLAVHYKDDRHSDRNPKSPTMDYRDVTSSLALEDTITLGDTTRLRLGGGHERREAREVYHWPTGSTSANSSLAELVHDLSADSQMFVSLAYKTRFPTIKDRYSARMGRALPNPDLKPESARHFELGWRGHPWNGAQLEATVFHSRIDDLIQDALVASTACGDTVCDQARNIGEARHRGIELSLQQMFARHGRLGANYAWLDRDNLSNPAEPLTHTPRQRLFVHASWTFSTQWRVMATAEAERGRIVPYSGSGRSAFVELDGFAILGAKMVWSPVNDLEIEVGGKNLGDRWHELSEGLPMPGRNWFANIIQRF